jgi:hypothetical protein
MRLFGNDKTHRINVIRLRVFTAERMLVPMGGFVGITLSGD